MTAHERLVEIVIAALSPCDLGDRVEVVHDVEALDVEMECDVDDVTIGDDDGTHQFVRFSAPYERIELALDERAFVRATIEEARGLTRASRASVA